MPQFVQLAKIGDSDAFIAAATSMGWDNTNYKEILADIGKEDGYIVNFDKTKNTLKTVTIVRANVFVTMGDGSGNRWFANELSAYIDKYGDMWITEEDAVNI